MKTLVLLGTICAFLVPSSWSLKCYSCAGVDCERLPSEEQEENCDYLTIVPNQEYYCGFGFADNSREKVVRRMCVLHDPFQEGCFWTDKLPGANYTCLCPTDFCNDFVPHKVPPKTTTTTEFPTEDPREGASTDENGGVAPTAAVALLVSGILVGVGAR
ncbi:unnamed protein product [Darwinula stevensoni]|uniref:Protein quiver n=1 Tax=Darwinula stevensoni TaxID=69355 RepID=A0A7R9A9Y6_9CRUS|nr:unnamed protein product [Darwinula stevensoni]CAG0897739.1 unnamed protein product [Darwinula stevensoni]